MPQPNFVCARCAKDEGAYWELAIITTAQRSWSCQFRCSSPARFESCRGRQRTHLKIIEDYKKLAEIPRVPDWEVYGKANAAGPRGALYVHCHDRRVTRSQGRIFGAVGHRLPAP